MKKVLIIISLIGLFTSAVAQDLVGAMSDVLKEKIKADAEVAKANKAKVTVENSVIEASSKMGNDNIAVGNIGGVVAVGEEVTIEGTTIKASSDMGNGNVAIGNVGGVVLGAH